MTPETTAEPTSYYFISDLHIGGDEDLSNVEFQAELLAFLRDLEESDENAELIVNGDAFGLWEFTDLEGLAKFDALVETYPDIFEQFRRTGERIPITFMPGNHDYELACYPEYVERLAEYNVTLEQEIVLTREVADRTIWIEHGQQRDPNNESPDFGNPYAQPPGYYVNRRVTSRAGKLSRRGKFNWLKDIQSVTPMTEIPQWMISKYFYREMSPLLRYAALPFLLLVNVSVVVFVAFLLFALGVWTAPFQILEGVLGALGIFGSIIDFIFFVNIVGLTILALLSVPGYFMFRDIRATLVRFGLINIDEPEDDTNVYLDGAREVFEANPEAAVFVYGHTHRPSVTEVDGRLVVNTGTWLKRLRRQEVVLGLLPWVFYSWFRLNYVRITEEDGSVVVEYHVIEKERPKDLTRLETLLTLTPKIDDPVPARSVVLGTSDEPTVESEQRPDFREQPVDADD